MDVELEPLSGSWSEVEGYGATYRATAEAIAEAITLMQTLRNGSSDSRAVRVIGDDTVDVEQKISQATTRYETTGNALVTYSESLRSAQSSATSAIEQATSTEQSLSAAESTLETLEAIKDPSPEVQTQIDSQRGVVAAHQAAYNDAVAAWHSAATTKDEAGDTAANAIKAVLEGSDLNDSFWDDVWGGVKGFLRGVVQVFVTIVQAVIAIVVGIVIAAVAAVVGLLATVIGMILYNSTHEDKYLTVAKAGLGLVAGSFSWLTGGGLATFVATFVRSGGTWSALSDAGVQSVIAWAVRNLPSLSNTLVDGDAGEPNLVAKSSGIRPVHAVDSAGDVLGALQADNVAVDAQTKLWPDAGQGPSDLNAKNSSEILVTAVPQADGSTAYRVNIPSTQVWEMNSLSINDVHSDAAAKLSNEATQLELAVRDALVEAEVPAGSDVLLSGWSLGGITAGNLAADAEFTSQYNVAAVVTMGSSVDDQDIPMSIPVLDVAHSQDLVQRTELAYSEWHGEDPNRTKVTVDMPDGTAWPGHAGDAYRQTMQTQGDLDGSQAQEFVERNDLDRFFTPVDALGSAVGTEQSHAYRYQRG